MTVATSEAAGLTYPGGYEVSQLAVLLWEGTASGRRRVSVSYLLQGDILSQAY